MKVKPTRADGHCPQLWENKGSHRLSVDLKTHRLLHGQSRHLWDSTWVSAERREGDPKRTVTAGSLVRIFERRGTSFCVRLV
jgi:hypothetical protein